MAGKGKAAPDKGTQAKAREKARNQDAFLAALAQTGNISRSAAAVRIDRHAHYAWMAEDETYPERVAAAFDIAADELEAEARRRAVEGLRRYKFDRSGKPLLHPETGQPYCELEYSDPLLIFLLKGAKPARYRERHEHTGADGGPITTRDTTVDLTKLSTATLRKVMEELGEL